MLSDAPCPRCEGALALSDTAPEAGYRATERYSAGRPRPGVVGLCSRCELMIEDVALMLEANEADRASVLDAIDCARRARALFDRGHGDKHAAMSALAGAFHALRHGVPQRRAVGSRRAVGVARRGHGERLRARLRAFRVLTVWDRRGPAGPFDAMGALVGWDRAHPTAFIEWARGLVAVGEPTQTSRAIRAMKTQPPPAPADGMLNRSRVQPMPEIIEQPSLAWCSNAPSTTRAAHDGVLDHQRQGSLG